MDVEKLLIMTTKRQIHILRLNNVDIDFKNCSRLHIAYKYTNYQNIMRDIYVIAYQSIWFDS